MDSWPDQVGSPAPVALACNLPCLFKVDPCRPGEAGWCQNHGEKEKKRIRVDCDNLCAIRANQTLVIEPHTCRHEGAPTARRRFYARREEACGGGPVLTADLLSCALELQIEV
jgi:hypothetical protein